MDDLSPQITKKYEVLEKMGEGGMGAVYKVRHRQVGTFQVIKLILAPLQARSDLRTRFLREATTAMQLRHPNIVEVTDYDVTEDGTAYIVMEFINGVSLRDALARAHGPLDHRFVVKVARQALAALGFMHRKNSIHRDISPENFILTRDDDGNPLIKLIDLGISKSAGQQALTQGDGFMGKASYAPPEQFRGEADARSDLYALGVMLYELLTDSMPIVGDNAMAIMASHLIDPPRPFAASDPAGRVPERLRAIVMKALEKDPAARWQTAQELAAALGTCEMPLLEKTLDVTIPILLSEDPASREREQTEWNEAKEVDSIAAWKRYLDRHPSAPRAERARLFIKALEAREEQNWQRASTVDSIEAWREFIRNHGDSPRLSNANQRLKELEQVQAEEQAWIEAVATDSVESWRRFLDEHPTSPRMDLARANARQAKERADLAIEEERERSARAIALQTNTAQSLHAFLEAFPASPAAAEVWQRIEEADWNAALAEDRPAAWESFIARHPHTHAGLARKHLQVAREEAQRDAEAQAWIVAANDGTREAYEAFLRDHPIAENAAEAHRRLDALLRHEQQMKAWTAATTQDDLKEFIRSYPDSSHVPAARQRLEQIAAEDGHRDAWKAATTKEDLDLFVRKYPKSSHVDEAWQRIEEIEAREERERSLHAAEEAWEKVSSREAAERFLQDYPNSPLVSEAKPLIEKSAPEGKPRRVSEAKAWRNANHIHSKEAFAAFIRDYPQASHAAEALRQLTEVETDEQRRAEADEAKTTTLRDQRLAKKAWTTAKDAGTQDGFERFIREHPTSQFVADANRALNDIDTLKPRPRSIDQATAAWDEARRMRTESAFRSFLRRYPESVHAAKAQQELSTIEEEDRDWQRALALDTVDAIESFARKHPQSHTAGVRHWREVFRLRTGQQAERQAAKARRAEARRRRATAVQGTAGAANQLATDATADPIVKPRLGLGAYSLILLGTLLTALGIAVVIQKSLAGLVEILIGVAILLVGARKRLPGLSWATAGLAIFGTLLTAFGFAVVIQKGPAGWIEVVLGVAILAAVARKWLRGRALLWAAAGLIVAVVIAYDLSQPPSGPNDENATDATATVESP